MSCWTKEQLEQMLFDVVNELDLSDGMCEKHGPHGTAPAVLVREVLAQKDMQIRMLQNGMVDVRAAASPASPSPPSASVRAEPLRDVTEAIAIQEAIAALDEKAADLFATATEGRHRAYARQLRGFAKILSRRLTTAGSGWRPIETAPKDGRCVLLGRSGFVSEGYWDCSDSGRHRLINNDVPILPFTHWQPLPAAPTPARDGGGDATPAHNHGDKL